MFTMQRKRPIASLDKARVTAAMSAWLGLGLWLVGLGAVALFM